MQKGSNKTIKRCGVIAQKVGMSRLFQEDGKHCPVSMLKLAGARVLDIREQKERAGMFQARIAIGKQKKQRLTKSMQGVFAKADCPPMRKIVSFSVSEEHLPVAKAEISVNHFVQGQFVDATARSIGKGFAGAMKRHGFKGLRATHGVSVSHRSMGSTGNREFPGKVFKGKKMPGRMGGKQVTVQNLKIVALDEERDLIFVKGAVPGACGGWVVVKDAVKKPLPANIVKSAGVKGDAVNNDSVESSDESTTSPVASSANEQQPDTTDGATRS